MAVKERRARLAAIEKLIKNNRIESQESLLAHLQKAGYDVTQATLSRDLKLLKVGYIYTLEKEEERTEAEKIYIQDFLRGYISIDCSGNIVVIKTFPGHANTVSNALDNMDLDDILGTVAGDNCLFACLREGVSGAKFLKSLRQKIPGLEA